jgi:hypothetical protein
MAFSVARLGASGDLAPELVMSDSTKKATPEKGNGKKKVEDPLKDIVSLAKRRGLVYPGSDIYGGLANTFDYGPYGTELMRNLKDMWWRAFVREREDVVGLDSSTVTTCTSSSPVAITAHRGKLCLTVRFEK